MSGYAHSENATNTDRRRFERQKAKLRVTIIIGKRIFRSRSENISSGGILLEDKVTWLGLGAKCTVIIGLSKMNIEINGNFVEGSEKSDRISFDQNSEALPILERFLKQCQNDLPLAA